MSDIRYLLSREDQTNTLNKTPGYRNKNLFRYVPVVFILLSISSAYLLHSSMFRLVFPAASFLVSGFLLQRNQKARFVELVMLLFFFTPLIRRLVDVSAGFQQINLVMLAPYAAASCCIPLSINHLIRTDINRGDVPFLLIFASIFYGVDIDIFGGNLFLGVFNALTWIAPPCLGLMIIQDKQRISFYKDTFIKTALLGTFIISVYGIYQFINPPPWDIYWMANAGMTSVGLPEPYAVRIFGTMNSPEPYAQVLSFMMLVIISLSTERCSVLILGFAAIALMLSMTRTAWMGFAVGLLFLLFAGNNARTRVRTLSITAVACLTIPILLSLPEVSENLAVRFSSFFSLQQDISYADRLTSYKNYFAETFSNNLLGGGFANVGFRSSYNGGSSVIVDGSLIEIARIYGLFFGVVYICGLCIIIFKCFWIAIKNKTDHFVGACGAVVFSAAIMLSSASTFAGECGIFAWLAVAFCLADRPTERVLQSLSDRGV